MEYWLAAADATNTRHAWVMFFDDGDMGFVVKSIPDFVWCVRDGQGVDP